MRRVVEMNAERLRRGGPVLRFACRGFGRIGNRKIEMARRMRKKHIVGHDEFFGSVRA